MAKSSLALLRAATSNLVRVRLPPAESSIQDYGLYSGKFSTQGEVIGFNIEGARALAELVRQFISQNANYRRGASVDRLFEQITDHVIQNLLGRSSQSISHSDVIELQTHVSAWFQSVTGIRRHYVPCSIIPGSCAPFSIGPVCFMTMQHLAERERVNSERFGN